MMMEKCNESPKIFETRLIRIRVGPIESPIFESEIFDNKILILRE
jgi:hypothetical protein